VPLARSVLRRRDSKWPLVTLCQAVFGGVQIRCLQCSERREPELALIHVALQIWLQPVCHKSLGGLWLPNCGSGSVRSLPYIHFPYFFPARFMPWRPLRSVWSLSGPYRHTDCGSLEFSLPEHSRPRSVCESVQALQPGGSCVVLSSTGLSRSPHAPNSDRHASQPSQPAADPLLCAANVTWHTLCCQCHVVQNRTEQNTPNYSSGQWVVTTGSAP
jgi:hypothetical protein